MLKQVLVQWVWAGAWDSAFLTSFQSVLLLMVGWPYTGQPRWLVVEGKRLRIQVGGKEPGKEAESDWSQMESFLQD